MDINNTKAVATIIHAVSPEFILGATLGKAVWAESDEKDNADRIDASIIFFFILNFSKLLN